MKIECVQEKLRKVISLTEKITGRNLALPVLNCLLIEARKNSLFVRSTNLELGIEVEIPAKVAEEGVVAIPASILSSFISNIKTDTGIVLEKKEGVLRVSTKHSSTTIKTVPHEDFPLIPKITHEIEFSLDPQEFVSGLRSVWYSGAINSMKPELSSVMVSCDGESLVFAATDSFRLAERKIKTKKTKNIEPFLIPIKNVQEIIRILSDVSHSVDIKANKNQISFVFDNTHLVSRIIDGVFPDYKQIIPKEHKTEMVILKEEFINTLKVANIFSDKFNQINFNLKPKENVSEVKTTNADVGESVNSLEATLNGEDISISFNYKYITDCFQSVASDSVSVTFNGSNKPAVIRPLHDNGFLYLVMPTNR